MEPRTPSVASLDWRSSPTGEKPATTPELEARDDLLRRIDEASRYVPTDNLALSPQCGFASTLQGIFSVEDNQWRKLELVTTVARKSRRDE